MRKFAILLSVFMGLFVSQIVAAKPVPSEHYSRLPAIYDAALSPDGKFLATVVDNGGEYILRVFNIADPSDEKVRAMGYGNGVKVKWIKWANNDQILLSTRQTQKNHGTIYNAGYLFVIDRDVTGRKLVLEPGLMNKTVGSKIDRSTGSRQFNNVVIDFLPDDPDHILMAFGLEDQFVIGVHKVNIKTQRNNKLKRGSSEIQYWTTDLRHEVRVGEGRKDRSGDFRMIIRDTNGKTWRDVKEYPGLTAKTRVFGFTENPDELIIGQYNSKDTQGLYIYNLAQKTRTRKLFHNDKYDVTGILLSADGAKSCRGPLFSG